MAVKWGLKDVELMTDSATVFSWFRSVLFDCGMVRTKGMSEMLVRRRLSIVKDICNEYGMHIRA